MNNKLPITGIIITHRSDDRFEKSKHSLAFVDELIIEHHPVINNFSEVRNKAMAKAKHNWIIFLDSDEFFENTEHLYNQLSKSIYNEKISGLLIQRIDSFHDREMKWGETRNNWQLRIFKKDNYKYLGSVHEAVAPINKKNEALPFIEKIIETKIKHHSHLSITEFLADISKYAEIHTNYLSKSKYKLILEMILFPLFKFIYNFFFKLGFLDGWRGVVYAYMMSLHSLISRVTAYEKISQGNH